MAITPAFQVGERGSIPLTRSMKHHRSTAMMFRFISAKYHKRATHPEGQLNESLRMCPRGCVRRSPPQRQGRAVVLVREEPRDIDAVDMETITSPAADLDPTRNREGPTAEGGSELRQRRSVGRAAGLKIRRVGIWHQKEPSSVKYLIIFQRFLPDTF